MWQKKPGTEHDAICGRTLEHRIHLFNNVTGGEHILQIVLKIPHCDTCKRPFIKTDAERPEWKEPGIIDPRAEVAKAIDSLNRNHAAIMEYASTHNVPILIGPLGAVVPPGHTVHTSRAGRSLIPPRKP